MIKIIVVTVFLANLLAITVEASDLKLEPCTELDKLIPDAKNCSRFYECTLGGWVGLFCYPGLKFNPVTERCDYPENVKCPNETIVENLKLEPCTELDKLIPDPKNCSRFYECTLSGWVGLFCYPGLKFNPVTERCDYPENVKCPNETIVQNLKLEPCTELDKLIPDPKNCSRFYECTLSGWVGLFCYPGLKFNPVTERCDYPENVKCPNETIVEGVQRPYCGSENYDELFPDPYDCNRFFECSSLGLVPFKCPANLQFNPVTKLCDYRWRVRCSN